MNEIEEARFLADMIDHVVTRFETGGSVGAVQHGLNWRELAGYARRLRQLAVGQAAFYAMEVGDDL